MATTPEIDEETKKALGVTDEQIAENDVVAVDTADIISMEDTGKRAEVLANADFERDVADIKAGLKNGLFSDIDKTSTLYKEMEQDINDYYDTTKNALQQKYSPEQADSAATVMTNLMFNLSRIAEMPFKQMVALNPIRINFNDEGNVTGVTLTVEDSRLETQGSRHTFSDKAVANIRKAYYDWNQLELKEVESDLEMLPH